MLDQGDHELLQPRVLAGTEGGHDAVDEPLLDCLLLRRHLAVDRAVVTGLGRAGVDVGSHDGLLQSIGSPAHAAFSSAVRFSSVTGVGLLAGTAFMIGPTALAMPSSGMP